MINNLICMYIQDVVQSFLFDIKFVQSISYKTPRILTNF